MLESYKKDPRMVSNVLSEQMRSSIGNNITIVTFTSGTDEKQVQLVVERSWWLLIDS